MNLRGVLVFMKSNIFPLSSLLIALLLALTACSGHDNHMASPAKGAEQVKPAPQEAAKPTAAAAGPSKEDLTFTDETKTTVTLPKKAERIVCLTDLCVDILAELGMEPVAVKDNLAKQPEFFGEKGKSFPVIGGAFNDPNMEDLAKAKPDLVIGLNGNHNQLRDALKPIAPLYIVYPKTYQDSIEYLKTVGKLTGKQEQAEKAVKTFTDKLNAYKSKSPKNKVPLVMYGSNVNFGIYTEGNVLGTVVREIANYSAWPAPASGTPEHGSGQIKSSVEHVLKVNPDALFVLTISYGPNPTEPISKQLAANPLWKELKSVKDGQVHEMRFDVWGAGRGTRSLGIVLDELATKLYPDVFPKSLP